MKSSQIHTISIQNPGDHLGLVYWCAKRFHTPFFDREDLIQIGVIGLLKAVKKFDPSRNINFSSYAVHRIQGEIRDAIRDAARDYRACKEMYQWTAVSQYSRSPDFATYRPRRQAS